MSEPTPTPELIGWVDPAALAEREAWADEVDPETLAEVLGAAYEQCVLFLNGRIPAEDEPVPNRLALAQKLQARALLRSSSAGSGDQTGIDGLSVTVFPMDWTVKNLLRPRRGRRGPR